MFLQWYCPHQNKRAKLGELLNQNDPLEFASNDFELILRKRTRTEEKEEKPSKQGRQKEIKRQSTVYEPTFEKLPKGWTEFFDIEKGAPYYFNHNTQVTCWERPV